MRKHRCGKRKFAAVLCSFAVLTAVGLSGCAGSTGAGGRGEISYGAEFSDEAETFGSTEISDSTEISNSTEVSNSAEVSIRIEKTVTEAAPEDIAGGETTEIVESRKNQLLNMEITTEQKSEWGGDRSIFWVQGDQIHVANEGYEELKAALDSFNKETWGELRDVYEKQLPEIRKLAVELGEDTGGYQIYRKISPTRGDSRILSFYEDEYSYLGGSQPDYYRAGYTFDVKTGNKSSLFDVAADYDSLCRVLAEQLEEGDQWGVLFEDHRETLKEMFYGDGSGLEWYVTPTAFVFYVNRYFLAPYASGAMEVSLEFSEYPELFKEEYFDGLTAASPV